MTPTATNGTAAPAHEQLQFILDKLGGECFESGGTYSVRCPAHDDEHPSLDLRVKDGKLVMCCRRGCENGKILEVIGLTWPQVFRAGGGNGDGRQGGNGHPRATPRPKRKAKPKPTPGPVVKTYFYEDENRVVRHRTTRHDPKDFRQARPDPDREGQWINSIHGIPRLLYRLPELLAEPGRAVFVVEGEKDVETLFALDLLATTNPMGAKKFDQVDAEVVRRAFGGRPAFLLPDNDDAGAEHCAAPGRRRARRP